MAGRRRSMQVCSHSQESPWSWPESSTDLRGRGDPTPWRRGWGGSAPRHPGTKETSAGTQTDTCTPVSVAATEALVSSSLMCCSGRGCSGQGHPGQCGLVVLLSRDDVPPVQQMHQVRPCHPDVPRQSLCNPRSCSRRMLQAPLC